MRVPDFNWKRLSLIYPCELVIGCAIAWILGEDRLAKQRKEQYLLRPGNFINRIFAYQGNLIWTILFIAFAFVQIYIRRLNSIPLPRDARTVKSRSLLRELKQYGCKIILKNFLLMLIFGFIDNVFVLTGGSCSDNSNTHSAERCRKNGGKWEGGFDISGHFCFLVNVSMILWLELEHFQSYVKEQEITAYLNRFFKGIIMPILGVLTIWILILMVTSIYYHTILEKVIGCAMGYICVAIMYGIIPNNSRLNQLLYQ